MDDGVEISEDKYLLSSLTKACKYVNDKVTIRLPINKPILHMLLGKIDTIYDTQVYLATMYKALYCTTYYGLFRVGEVTSGSHPIKAKDVHIGENKDKLLFVLHTSKTHWLDVKPQTVKISSTQINGEKGDKLNPEWCPFNLIREYLKIRKPYLDAEEPFFVFYDRSPVKPENMRKTLKSMLQLSGLNPDVYNCHSIRGGRAGDLLSYGIQIPVLKKLGRWSSNAVYAYLQ